MIEWLADDPANAFGAVLPLALAVGAAVLLARRSPAVVAPAMERREPRSAIVVGRVVAVVWLAVMAVVGALR